MLTHIITLEDGTRIEAQNVSPNVSQPAPETEKRIEEITPLLTRIVRPVNAAWDQLGNSVTIESAEIEVGIGIESSGNFFIVGAKGNVNFKVKLTLTRNTTRKLAAEA